MFREEHEFTRQVVKSLQVAGFDLHASFARHACSRGFSVAADLWLEAGVREVFAVALLHTEKSV